MKWSYIVSPGLLMVSFAAYAWFYPKAKSKEPISMDSPFSWPRDEVRVGPAVEIALHESYSGRDPESEAREAIRTGQILYFQFAGLSPWHEEFAMVLRRRFGVRVHMVVEPLILDSQTDYFAAYNGVIEKYIERFGWSAYWDAVHEAKALFARRGSKKG